MSPFTGYPFQKYLDVKSVKPAKLLTSVWVTTNQKNALIYHSWLKETLDLIELLFNVHVFVVFVLLCLFVCVCAFLGRGHNFKAFTTLVMFEPKQFYEIKYYVYQYILITFPG